MIRIRQSVYIEVGHFMPVHPKEENRRIHGHTVKVTVTAEGERKCGAVMDFDVFRSQVETIAGLLDHRLLNEIEGLEFPTLENIAEWIGQRMAVVGPLRTVSVVAEREHLGQAAEWTP